MSQHTYPCVYVRQTLFSWPYRVCIRVYKQQFFKPFATKWVHLCHSELHKIWHLCTSDLQKSSSQNSNIYILIIIYSLSGCLPNLNWFFINLGCVNLKICVKCFFLRNVDTGCWYDFVVFFRLVRVGCILSQLMQTAEARIAVHSGLIYTYLPFPF